MTTWKPATIRSIGSLDDLCALWAPVLGLQLQRVMEPAEVRQALSMPAPPDDGVEAALERWSAVPLDCRFVPPGIRRDGVTELDIRVWLKVGAILERGL